MKTLFARLALVLVVSGLSGFISACDPVKDYIDKATFKASDDHKIIDVAIHFTSKVKFKLEHQYDIKEYGYAYIRPYEKNVRNFEAGLHVSTDVLADSEFATKRETSFLPNGLSTGLPYPVVEIRADEPITPRFDIMGYFDLRHLSWLGTAFLVNVADEYNFPEDLMITAGFLNDSQGQPALLVRAFGATLGEGEGKTPASGAVIFANIRAIFDEKLIPPGETELKPIWSTVERISRR